MKGDMCFFNMFKYKINILMTWKVADVGGYDWLKIVDEVDSLHVKRNHLVGWNADEFSPGLVTLVNCVAVVNHVQLMLQLIYSNTRLENANTVVYHPCKAYGIKWILLGR
jgi:hypothetical protein